MNHPQVESVIARGDTKTSVSLVSGIQCDLRAVTTAEYPFSLNYFTGSKEHNVRYGARLDGGWSLNEYRFSRAEGGSSSSRFPMFTSRLISTERSVSPTFSPNREDRGEWKPRKADAFPT